VEARVESRHPPGVARIDAITRNEGTLLVVTTVSLRANGAGVADIAGSEDDVILIAPP
jgi:hypothetical protein